MTTPLSGTVALVTGASSGIGEQTAVALAGLGADVVVAARRTDRLDALVDRISADGGKALAVAADVTDEAQANDAVAAAVDRFGRPGPGGGEAGGGAPRAVGGGAPPGGG